MFKFMLSLSAVEDEEEEEAEEQATEQAGQWGPIKCVLFISMVESQTIVSPVFFILSNEEFRFLFAFINR